MGSDKNGTNIFLKLNAHDNFDAQMHQKQTVLRVWLNCQLKPCFSSLRAMVD